MAQLHLFFGLRLLLFGIAAAVLFAISTQNCQAQQNQIKTVTPREITSRRAFFERGFGSLAFLPSISTKTNANRTGLFQLLESDSANVIRPKQGHLWFQFSHYLPESDGKPTFVGILVIKVLNTSTRSHLITVYRNPNWKRPGTTTSLGVVDKKLNIPWTSFTNNLERWAMSTNVSMSDLDIGDRWHAMPTNNTPFSWEYRKFWPNSITRFAQTVSQAAGKNFNTNCVSVSTQLIKFIPTKTPGSQHPVTFEVIADDATALFIALDSPDSGEQTDEFSRTYWVSLQK